MAQETAVHRADAQSAFGAPTAVDSALALDGIAEVLHLMLAGDWADEPQPGSAGSVTVAAAERVWTVHLRPGDIEVADGEHPTEAKISGTPSDVLLWLWGRVTDTAITATGKLAAVQALRQRLALATG